MALPLSFYDRNRDSFYPDAARVHRHSTCCADETGTYSLFPLV